MSNLTDAIEAADARKIAALGDDAIVVAPTRSQRMAIFSGFDIDPAEYAEIQTRVGLFFAHMAASDDTISLPASMASSWTDGFLIGLMFKRDSDGD